MKNTLSSDCEVNYYSELTKFMNYFDFYVCQDRLTDFRVNIECQLTFCQLEELSKFQVRTSSRRRFGSPAAIASRVALSRAWGLMAFNFAVSISEAIRPSDSGPSLRESPQPYRETLQRAALRFPSAGYTVAVNLKSPAQPEGAGCPHRSRFKAGSRCGGYSG